MDRVTEFYLAQFHVDNLRNAFLQERRTSNYLTVVLFMGLMAAIFTMLIAAKSASSSSFTGMVFVTILYIFAGVIVFLHADKNEKNAEKIYETAKKAFEQKFPE